MDNQLLNGAAAAPAMNGLITQVGLPSAARGTVEDWKSVVDQFVDQIDGLWASELSDLFLVTNPDGYKLRLQALPRGNWQSGDTLATCRQ